MNQIYYFMISYCLIIALFFGLSNWLSSGFLWYFIRVKMSRGKRVLVINKGVIENYASIGWVEGTSFRYKDRETKLKENNKVSKRLDVPSGESPFFRLFGVTCVQVDEKNTCFIMPSGSSQSGYDSVKQENLILWALQRPRNEEKLKMLIIVCLCLVVLCLFISGFVLVKVNGLTGIVQGGFSNLTRIQGVNLP